LGGRNFAAKALQTFPRLKVWARCERRNFERFGTSITPEDEIEVARLVRAREIASNQPRIDHVRDSGGSK
jgi:hypothetical protein